MLDGLFSDVSRSTTAKGRIRREDEGYVCAAGGRTGCQEFHYSACNGTQEVFRRYLARGELRDILLHQ